MDPDIADDLTTYCRYNAACAAALAGCGQGEDAAKIDAKERDRWRKQALDWLRADLALRTKQIDDGKPEDRAAASRTLRHWKADPDLAGVRDPEALAVPPPDEQDAWRKLWAEVDALLMKAQEKRPRRDLPSPPEVAPQAGPPGHGPRSVRQAGHVGPEVPRRPGGEQARPFLAARARKLSRRRTGTGFRRAPVAV